MKRYNIVNNTLGWLCFAIAAVTYLLTIEPTASFWDCPEFISQGAKLEVGHPPGNPIFMLTARFFVTIFGGSIQNAAVAVNSMSALLSAATILLLFWTITHLTRKIIARDGVEDLPLSKMIVIMGAGLCGALAYTWSDTFWFSAVEGEVYAFSSFCTALVFWLILKWENRADQPHSDRYLVLIAYVIGVSIAVHLLNLLCIPAIVLVFYYKKWKNTDAKGSLIALGVSFVIVAAILYGLVPGFIKVAQFFELFFVNTCGMGYNMGALIYAIVLIALFTWSIATLQAGNNAGLIKTQMLLVAMASGLTFITDNGWIWLLLIAALAVYLFAFCKKVPQRVFNVILLSIAVIFVGYSSYALLLIRASANTPMNQNAPDNVFALSSYLNREQYGQRPLMFGTVFADTYSMAKDEDGTLYVEVDERGLPREVSLSMGDVLYYTNDGHGNYRPKIEHKKGYAKVAKSDSTQKDEYVKEVDTPEYTFSPDLNMVLPRLYSMDPQHVKGYKSWAVYTNEDLARVAMAPEALRKQWAEQGAAPLYQIAPYMKDIKYISLYEGATDAQKLPVWKPTFADNLRYFFNYQLNHMYWRYFMWNFAGRQNDIQGNGEATYGNWISGIPAIDNMRLGDQSLLPERYGTGNKGHNVFYMLPLLMGLIGLLWQSLPNHKDNPKRGIEQFWVVFFLFFMTGIAIVLYLNQTPGQPRERDYAFAGSFYAFAIWIGLGVPAIAWLLEKALAKTKGGLTIAAAIAAVIGLIVPVQMVSQTWDDHDRSNRYTTRDFGANYLNSLEPNAIIFTNGDNDTFPLWYQQEVEGTRTDVRVVNLSYLSTDWYANQMRHPVYDAAAINTTARPTDYAYDKLSYNRATGNEKLNQEDSIRSFFFPTDGRTEAIAGLEAFYANPDGGLRTPDMVSVVDPEAAIKAFNVNPNSADSTQVLPYMGNIDMKGLSGGFTLSNLLSFDIIANSVARGFDRPVYFASTVPDSYYLGLSPYMYSTGVALQLTPFKDAAASPMAEKAYENIVSKFKWGGLDDPDHGTDLYLDETVRRMVATTRNSMIETAKELTKRGNEPASEFAVTWAKENGQDVPATKYDMARTMLNLMLEKLPAEAADFESLTDIETVSALLTLYNATGDIRDLEAADAVASASLPFYAQLLNYAASLPSGLNVGSTNRSLLQYATILVVQKNYIDLSLALAKKGESLIDEQKALLADAMKVDNAFYLFDFLFGGDETTEDLQELALTRQGTLAYILSQAAAISAANEQAGIKRTDYARELMAKYGARIEDLMVFAN